MAIGDWNDTRNRANYQQLVEHEEYLETAMDQYHLLVGYERLCCAMGEEWLSFNSPAWTDSNWYTMLYLRPGIAWDCLGAWIYVNPFPAGTNYLKLEIRDATDAIVASIPNATGITIDSSGWKQIAKCFSSGLSESPVVAYSVAIMGRCPAGNMDVGYLQLYLTSALEP